MLEWIQRLPVWFWIALIVHGTVLGSVAYLILLERKVASWVQDRLGPNRVGPGGLLQPLADGLKFIFKEDYRPGGVDKVLFTLAPGLMIAVIIVSIAVIPWGGMWQRTWTVQTPANVTDQNAAIASQIPYDAQVVSVVPAQQANTYAVTFAEPFQIASLNIGVLFILAILSLAVYGVVIGGWASNNKYSFLGGLRATANMISYEIPLALGVLTIVVMFGTLDLGVIVDKQAHYWAGYIPAWNVFTQPLTFLLFLVCIHAEANRAPFDLAEAEQELVGGYHTEYSSMRFALFFLGEYAGMITTSALCVALFFGGWHLPGLTGPAENPGLSTSLWVCILRAVVFFAKTIVIIFVFMWVRWSLPRFRFDQLMMLAWRGLIPVSLVLMLATAIVMYFAAPLDALFVAGQGIGGWLAFYLLIANVVITVGAMLISTILPPAPKTNRRIKVEGSRFDQTPLPAGT
jgi:NADH-quinone oxidoreductase subunit H